MNEGSFLCDVCTAWACPECRRKLDQAANEKSSLATEMVIVCVASLVLGAGIVYLIDLLTSF